MSPDFCLRNRKYELFQPPATPPNSCGTGNIVLRLPPAKPNIVLSLTIGLLPVKPEVVLSLTIRLLPVEPEVILSLTIRLLPVELEQFSRPRLALRNKTKHAKVKKGSKRKTDF